LFNHHFVSVKINGFKFTELVEIVKCNWIDTLSRQWVEVLNAAFVDDLICRLDLVYIWTCSSE
jgi:hypothetical protein